MAHGHQIPTMDMAKLLAERGVRATIFPAVEAGLLEGCENVDSLNFLDMVSAFTKATQMLQQPFEQLVQDHQPSCLVADMFFPWATDIAAKFAIPRLIFHGTCFFLFVQTIIKFTRMQLPDLTRQEVETGFSKLFKEVMESELRSYGVVVNNFYELESDYAEHFKKVIGRKAWHIGLVSLCNKEVEDNAKRGKETSIDEHECLKWLATRKPNSVLYVCFGSIANFSDSQLMEIAMGLEAFGQQFIWVVRKGKNEKEEEDWLPKGFEKRMESKGLIIRGVSAEVPMVTWPMGAEQFFNEKIVTYVLKLVVDVCAYQWTSMVGDGIKREALEKAMRQIMVREEADEMRGRAKAFGKMARRTVGEGGSSYSNLNALIEELSLHCP
ncbi:hypothetical protein RGQ29_005578 [Quercus rubra]|uniref:Uncharacterized protein n=1 Tax=Quercus rubra TaxID=3512 RepID=A0AAN7E4X5_QUERU|nr:hypothetical protein RGQ29_005578 [Quercus rubra]